MKSLLTKRLPGILALGMVTLAVGAAGVTSGATAGTTNDASISALTAKQKKAKAKELKKCKKINKASKRKACIKRVNKKYKKLAENGGGNIPIGATKEVSVEDDFYSPALLDIKVGDQVNWVWDNTNANAHNVTLSMGPSSLTDVDIYELRSPNSPATNYSFKRQLTKPGKYDFYCTLHSTVMKMTVNVTK